MPLKISPLSSHSQNKLSLSRFAASCERIFSDPDNAYRDVLKLIQESFVADSCLIFVLSGKDELEERASVNLKASDKIFSKTILEKVIKEKKSVYYPDATKIDELKNNESIMKRDFLSVIATPLQGRGGELLGALYLQRHSGARIPFREEMIEEITGFVNKITYILLEQEKLRRRHYSLENIIGASKTIVSIKEKIKKIADTNVTVFIKGESGTGKKLVAEAIHYSGNRAESKFIYLNCGSLPEGLLESELFGHEKGAFTGALMNKKGLLEVAHGGTIFLDEIGKSSFSLQVKLLNFLDDGIIRPIGSTEYFPLDTRVITADNLNLEEQIELGKFSQDLYFRINVFPIEIPPLRERKEDILILVPYFLRKFCNKYDRLISDFEFSGKDIDIFFNYDWPGNVRELENVINAGIVQSSNINEFSKMLENRLKPVKKSKIFFEKKIASIVQDLRYLSFEEKILLFKHQIIIDSLQRNNENKSQATKELNIDTKTINTILEKYKKFTIE